MMPEVAAVRFAREFYDVLADQAKPNPPGPDLFEGSITEAFRSMGKSNTHYPVIRRLLIESGCIKILRQGTRAEPSLVEILKPLPPAEEISPDVLTAPERHATLDELDRRVSRLEAWVDQLGGLNVAEALLNMERRLTKLHALLAPDEANTGSS